MLKATELRIGNYVSGSATNGADIVEFAGYISEISLTHVRLTGSVPEKTDGIKVPVENLYGAPLIEEWLLKAGFTEHSHRGLSLFPFGLMLDPFFRYEEDKTVWYGTPGDECTTELKYIHQLQNLYFALTGQELIHA